MKFSSTVNLSAVIEKDERPFLFCKVKDRPFTFLKINLTNNLIYDTIALLEKIEGGTAVPKLLVHYTAPWVKELPLEKTVFEFLKTREESGQFDELWDLVNETITQRGQRGTDNVTAIYAEDEDGNQIIIAEF